MFIFISRASERAAKKIDEETKHTYIERASRHGVRNKPRTVVTGKVPKLRRRAKTLALRSVHVYVCELQVQLVWVSVKRDTGIGEKKCREIKYDERV